MTVEFMLTDNEELVIPGEYTVIDSYYCNEYGGYELVHVEVEKIEDVHIENVVTGIEYEIDQYIMLNGIAIVTVWRQIEG